ncbi:hypothetical protein PMAYCL1PPCAC_17073, partial [Pristionchus mayeri]
TKFIFIIIVSLKLMVFLFIFLFTLITILQSPLHLRDRQRPFPFFFPVSKDDPTRVLVEYRIVPNTVIHSVVVGYCELLCIVLHDQLVIDHSRSDEMNELIEQFIRQVDHQDLFLFVARDQLESVSDSFWCMESVVSVEYFMFSATERKSSLVINTRVYFFI